MCMHSPINQMHYSVSVYCMMMLQLQPMKSTESFVKIKKERYDYRNLFIRHIYPKQLTSEKQQLSLSAVRNM